MEIEEYHIDEVLNRFAEFLRGCGFQIKGEESLAIVNDFENQYAPDVGKKPTEEEKNIFKNDTLREYHFNQILYKNVPLENYKANWYKIYGSIPDIVAQGKHNG
jgi:hypothetical protein